MATPPLDVAGTPHIASVGIDPPIEAARCDAQLRVASVTRRAPADRLYTMRIVHHGVVAICSPSA